MQNIAIFASGSGTNADRIMSYFEEHPDISVSLIISDKEDPGVKQYAKNHKVDFKFIPYKSMLNPEFILTLLREYSIDYLVLAGYMRLVPDFLVKEYRNRILNIHPALLPKYGGKDMYGMKVHEKVKEEGEDETGITIHLVNERYDEGEILFQRSTHINSENTAEEIAQKVHTLEHSYYPKVIHSWILDHS